MSTPKNQNQNIINAKQLFRLKRLPIAQQLPVNKIVAYLGLLLVNKGKTIPVATALRIIKQNKLDLKIEANSAIPTVNLLEALIHLVIYKRELLQTFFEHKEFEIWDDEVAGPLFDIMEELSEIYRL